MESIIVNNKVWVAAADVERHLATVDNGHPTAYGVRKMYGERNPYILRCRTKGKYTAKQVAATIGTTAETLNNWLVSQGYLRRDNRGSLFAAPWLLKKLYTPCWVEHRTHHSCRPIRSDYVKWTEEGLQFILKKWSETHGKRTLFADYGAVEASLASS